VNTNRDASIDRLLSQSVRPGDIPAASPDCLDADTLAAWAEGSLPEGEAAAAEAHASKCARCQAALATLVRIMPPAPNLQPWWRKRWAIAGLVPVTAGAIALAIWIRTPEPARSSTAAVQEVPAPSTAAPTEGRQQAPAAVEPPPSPSAQRPETPAASGRADAPPARAKETRPEAGAAFKDQEKKVGALQKSDEKARDALAAAPGAVTGRASMRNEAAGRLTFQSTTVEIASPDRTARWRIGAAGSIERTIDGGATWEPLASGTTQDLVAGAAPSTTVCWIVGRGGSVLLSTDGRTWQPLPFPERVDLVAVQAGDATSARVTTADGRAFRTADSGRTWTAVQEI
jgi:photosynthesis system II assembly factor YCF48-like protein